MSLLKIVLMLELNVWGLMILMFQEEGPIMRFVQWLKIVMQTKSGYLAVLLVVWSSIGFVGGLVIGRIIWMLQML